MQSLHIQAGPSQLPRNWH